MGKDKETEVDEIDFDEIDRRAGKADKRTEAREAEVRAAEDGFELAPIPASLMPRADSQSESGSDLQPDSGSQPELGSQSQSEGESGGDDVSEGEERIGVKKVQQSSGRRRGVSLAEVQEASVSRPRAEVREIEEKYGEEERGDKGLKNEPESEDEVVPVRRAEVKRATEKRTAVAAVSGNRRRNGGVMDVARPRREVAETAAEDEMGDLDELIDLDKDVNRIAETLDDLIDKHKRTRGRVLVIDEDERRETTEGDSEMGSTPFVLGTKVNKRPLGKASLPEDSVDGVESTKRVYSGKNVVENRREKELERNRKIAKRRADAREKFAYGEKGAAKAAAVPRPKRDVRAGHRGSSIGVWIAVMLLVMVLGAVAGAMVYLFFLY